MVTVPESFNKYGRSLRSFNNFIIRVIFQLVIHYFLLDSLYFLGMSYGRPYAGLLGGQVGGMVRSSF